MKAREREPVSSTGWQLSDSVLGPNEVINIKQIKAPEETETWSRTAWDMASG